MRPRSGRDGSAALDAVESAAAAFDRRQNPAARGVPLARYVVVGLALLAALDAFLASSELRWGMWVLAVLLAAGATLTAVCAADQPGALEPRRWQLQALASATLMGTLMVQGPVSRELTFAAQAGFGLVALFVAALASARVDGPPWSDQGLRTLVDSLIVAMAAGVVYVVVAHGASPSATGPLLPSAFAAAVYATLVTTRSALRVEPTGHDAWLLGGVGTLGVFVWGEAAGQLGLEAFGLLAVPGVALGGAAALAISAALGLRGGSLGPPVIDTRDDSRLRFGPAAAAALVILLLSWLELEGRGSRVTFFGAIVLFGLIVARLVSTLTENRRLLRRVERSGVFEEKLRDLGAALLAVLDRTEALELVCRTAQVSFGADVVHLWMVDHSTSEIEAAEVLGPRRQSVLMRRLHLDDSSSLAARVARTGDPEIVSHASSANLSNPFLTVLMHAQSLLAVPIARGRVVQGVLVCIDTRNPVAYGPQELAKAELLASQVAVALDNAYQHYLQQRRLEEITALYEFAQSAHTSTTPTDTARLLLPILKERLRYTYAAIWLRDSNTGTIRLAAGDSPGGVPLAGARPSPLAMAALSSGQPVHAGLGWANDDGYAPPRGGIRSQLAVPLVLKDRVLGVIDLESKQQNAYSLNDERLLVSLANHAGLAMDNLNLVEETRKVETLRELDRMKSELLSTVSHELRTPLGSIKGYATTLLTHENKLRREEKREFLEIIDSEADRLREMIENLLDLSRLEAGVLRMDPDTVRLGAMAREVARKVQLSSPKHTLLVDWEDDQEMVADGRRIYQVMQNLLSNAVKYAPEGGEIRLSGRFLPRELVVSVRDEGLGLPPRELSRIFDRFHRVGGEVSRRIGGTGLGLAICKAFVEAHGGRIWAESEGEGRGSTFAFALPRLAPPLLGTGGPLRRTDTRSSSLLAKGAS